MYNQLYIMFHSANKFLLTLSLLEIKFQIAIALSERNGTLKLESLFILIRSFTNLIMCVLVKRKSTTVSI